MAEVIGGFFENRDIASVRAIQKIFWQRML